MIINHSRKFIFIHVPKSAGTSLAATLSKYSTYLDQEVGAGAFSSAQEHYFSQRFGLRKHSTANEIKRIVGKDVWDGYFKFAFVRNPYDRLISAYNFLSGWAHLPEKFRWLIEQYPTVQSFLESGVWHENLGPDKIFSPQSYWLAQSSETGPLMIDCVGKVEKIQQDFALIRKKIEREGGQEEVLGILNKSRRSKERFSWTSQATAQVKKYYAMDFELFGYDTDPPLPIDF